MYQKAAPAANLLTFRRVRRLKGMERILTLLSFFVVLSSFTFGQQTTPNPCTTAQQKQLDFWLGEWDLTWPGEKQGEVGHGTNSIKRIMEGCVVQENFSGGDSIHLRGTSVSTFDASAGRWKQTWVDNEGGYLDFVGAFKDGQMILQRETERGGVKVLQRMVWKNITTNELEWSWEVSRDGGKTWEVKWPIHYKRRS
ncbi:MAG TPA: hypothetical protein VKV39_16020 [Candidatus Sulfotelmatobacter sp.]|nr:hypothetical protein [Candidatus Sulfotelmatobacter sp.]